MGNYDQMAAAVSELSGGKNVVLLDDIGMPRFSSTQVIPFS